MRYNFVRDTTNVLPLRDSEITTVERKYNFRFPEVLREYYSLYNGSSVLPTTLDIGGIQYVVDSVLPIVKGYYTLEEAKENLQDELFVPLSYYPIAFDPFGDKFLWDSLTGTIWFYHDDGDEEPILLFDSVKAFFEAMNEACLNGVFKRDSSQRDIAFLPLGSIVRLWQGNKKLMIVSRGMNVEHEGVQYFFDYCGVKYPEGAIEDQFSYFNDEQIQSVIFKGYHDDEDFITVSRLRDYLTRHPEINRYSFD